MCHEYLQHNKTLNEFMYIKPREIFLLLWLWSKKRNDLFLFEFGLNWAALMNSSQIHISHFTAMKLQFHFEIFAYFEYFAATIFIVNIVSSIIIITIIIIIWLIFFAWLCCSCCCCYFLFASSLINWFSIFNRVFAYVNFLRAIIQVHIFVNSASFILPHRNGSYSWQLSSSSFFNCFLCLSVSLFQSHYQYLFSFFDLNWIRKKGTRSEP